MSQSQTDDKIIEFANERTGTESAPKQTSQRLSHSLDTSDPLFTLYLRAAQDHEEKRFEHLRSDTDQIILFCGLFSATVAALIVPSISNPTNPPADLDLLSSCWLFSLLLSISCALMAVSLQRWAQPLTTVASPRYSTAEQVRLRILFAAGIEKLNFAFFVEALHFLVHAAFAVFLYGLFTYLLNNVSLATALVSYAWIAIFSLVYTWFTFQPIYQPGYPGYTPLSNILARIILVARACVLYGISRLSYLVPSLIRVSNANQEAARLRRGNLGLMKLAQDKAQKVQPKLDGDILKRTLDILRSDDDLEQFFEAIPGFCASKPVEDSRRSLDKLGPERLEGALVLFWNRTLSSNRVSESVKGRRMLVCMKVIEVAGLSTAVPEILQHFSGNLGGVSRSVEICHSPGVPPNGDTASLARGIIASIIAINDKRDERWSMFAKDDLGISEDVLRRYLDYGDSVLLADLIHITRQFFHGLQRNSNLARKSLNTLSSLTKFNILDTLPELQHDFCALWNEIVQQTKISADNIPFMDILDKIRGLYVDLHGTDAVFPSACTVSSHRTTHMQEAGGTTTSGASHSIAITPPIPPSDSSPGEVPAITLPSSMSKPIAPSPSGTGDSGAPRPDDGTTGLESSTAPTSALSPSDPNTSPTGATHHSGETGPTVTVENRLRPQDHDSSESTA